MHTHYIVSTYIIPLLMQLPGSNYFDLLRLFYTPNIISIIFGKKTGVARLDCYAHDY